MNTINIVYVPNPNRSWAAELGLVGAGKGCSTGAGKLDDSFVDAEDTELVDVVSDGRLLEDDGLGNSTGKAGLPLVLRLASFFLFNSISISASHDTFTGGGQTHSLI